jgi:7-cyano-7-deazaguanine synthase
MTYLHALSFAETIDTDAIFIGANAVGYSGHPDCRPEHIYAFQTLADLVIKKGVQLQVPLKDTWSCYRGTQKAHGTCDSDVLRLKGFQKAGIKDFIPYGA